MSPHRTLHVIETDGPGGAESVLCDLVRGLPSSAQHRALIPSNAGWLGQTLTPAEREIVAPSARGRAPVLDLPFIRALRAGVSRFRPTLVHAHSFDAGLYAALALVGSRLPLIVTVHGASDVERRSLRDRLKGLAYRRVTRIACGSHALAARARRVPGVPLDRVRAIHNGTDLSRISAARSPALRAALALSPGTRLIGALGNVRRPKAYELLLPAIAGLRRAGHDVHLAIAGDNTGPLGDALRAQCDALRLTDHVSLLGYRDDPGAFLAGLDLYVLSSTSEGFSLSTVQASAAGLPIVATRSGGPEEIVVHEETGLLVDPGSSAALEKGLAELLEHPDLGSRLGQAARARALDLFSLPSMLAAYQALYDEVAAS